MHGQQNFKKVLHFIKKFKNITSISKLRNVSFPANNNKDKRPLEVCHSLTALLSFREHWFKISDQGYKILNLSFTLCILSVAHTQYSSSTYK